MHDLALAHQVIHGAQRRLHRCQGIELMHEIEVQAVGAQPPQAVLHGLDDVPPRQAARVHVLPHPAAHLGGDHQFVPTATYQLAQDLFRAPARVGVGRIEKVDPDLAAPAEHRGRGLFVRIAPKGHRTKAQRGNLYARLAQYSVFHSFSFLYNRSCFLVPSRKPRRDLSYVQRTRSAQSLARMGLLHGLSGRTSVNQLAETHRSADWQSA